MVLEGRVSLNLPKGRYDLQNSKSSLAILRQGDSIGDGSVPPPPIHSHTPHPTPRPARPASESSAESAADEGCSVHGDEILL